MDSSSSINNNTSINTTMTAEATTTFFDDGASEVATFSHEARKDDIEIRLQGIRDFLAKPYLINATSALSTWTTTDLLSASLLSIDPGTLLSTLALWSNKIQGFNLIRGTFVFRVSLNATPFHQGKLLLHFLPQFSARTGIDAGFKDHNINITTKSMQPRVELDCRDTVAIMRIPYVAPTTYYSLNDSNSFGWGTFFLSVLAPLRTGGSGIPNIEYSVFVHMEDVELVAPFITQSSVKRFGGKSGVKAAAEVESQNLSHGMTISAALSKVGSAASTLADIPMLSSVAAPAAWVANALSATAAYFGFSKPYNAEATAVISRQVQRYMATSDGMDNCYPLSVSATNSLALTTEPSLCEEDEMSMRFLLSQPAYIPAVAGSGFQGGFQWTTSNLKGTDLLTRRMEPRGLNSSGTQTINSLSRTWYVGPPVHNLSQIFAQYRGSFVVHFKFAKTDFHSGRIAITWTPSQGSPNAPSLANGIYALREIVDIRTCGDISITLPYMLPTDYVFVGQPTGTLNVKVLNELVCPETCSQTVDVLWGVCGGPDFEYAVPDDAGTNAWPRPFVLQSGVGVCASECIGASSTRVESVVQAERCVGEKISSLRQLIRRYNQIFFRTMPAADGFFYWPFHFSSAWQNATTGAIEGNVAGGDLLSLIAPMYAFYRGSMRVTVQTNRAETSNATIYANVNGGSYSQVATQLSPITNVRNGTITAYDYAASPAAGSYTNITAGALVADGLGIVPFTVPYYSMTPMALVGNVKSDTFPESSNANLISQSRTILQVTGATSFTGSSLYRSAGEDFNLSYFVGCRPYLIN